MQGRTGRAPALPAFATLFAIASAHGAPAGATTPSLLWQGATSIGVQCLVDRDTSGSDAIAMEAALCERVRRLAARSAPAPVKLIPHGDPALLAPGTVALLVHASVQPAAQGRLLAFTIRPFRASAEQTEVLFGAAPRAAAIPRSGTASPALDAALAAALSETLPWQQRPQGPRPLGGRP